MVQGGKIRCSGLIFMNFGCSGGHHRVKRLKISRKWPKKFSCRLLPNDFWMVQRGKIRCSGLIFMNFGCSGGHHRVHETYCSGTYSVVTSDESRDILQRDIFGWNLRQPPQAIIGPNLRQVAGHIYPRDILQRDVFGCNLRRATRHIAAGHIRL